MDGKTPQRFIADLTCANQLQELIGDTELPYVGQLPLLELEQDEVYLLSGEDQSTCFFLFRLPEAWHPLMAFSKPVPGSLFGRPEVDWLYPALACVPMGWVSATSVIMSIQRTVAYGSAGFDPEEAWTAGNLSQTERTFTVSISTMLIGWGSASWTRPGGWRGIPPRDRNPTKRPPANMAYPFKTASALVGPVPARLWESGSRATLGFRIRNGQRSHIGFGQLV